MNANGVRVALYAAAALVALFAWWRERSDRRHPDWWPTFWLVTSVVLGAMALGRVLDLDVLTSFARNEAIADGWYQNRRRLQVIVVGGVCVFWAVTVLVALWRVPERRRRYLPTAIVVFSLQCYAAIRLVSLHHVDALLHRSELNGARLGALVEIGGALLTILVTLVVVTSGRMRSPTVAVPSR